MACLAIWIGNGTSGGTTRIAFNGLFHRRQLCPFLPKSPCLAERGGGAWSMSEAYMKKRGLLAFFEYPVLIALSVVGMMMMVQRGPICDAGTWASTAILGTVRPCVPYAASVKSTEARP